jgi:DNA topoisomerase IA
MGKFQPGYDPRRNLGGRPKGKANKGVSALREKVRKFIEENYWTIQQDFDQMESKDRLLFVERLLKHVLPPPIHPLEQLTEDQLKEVIENLKQGRYE